MVPYADIVTEAISMSSHFDCYRHWKMISRRCKSTN